MVFNNSMEKVKMAEQIPNVRNKNFDEVTFGYTKEEAKEEASRCLNCKKPFCIDGCPVSVDIPAFIKKITEDDINGAYSVIKKTNALPAVCGRVCPQEMQCEKFCVRAKKGESVAIGRLERFCADNADEGVDASADKTKIKNNGIKTAIVGSGPAGLACAGDLAHLGYEVHVFESFHVAGGVLVYGIPEFRLPKKIVEKEIENLKKAGVTFHANMVVGRIVSVEELFEQGYKAVFLASGAGIPNFMGIDGENAHGVMSANEYLTRINLMKAYDSNYDTPVIKGKKVAVVGGGNVAMDAARCAKRLGADEVNIIYRRSENEMPARREEVHHAKEEGITFRTLTNPVKINVDSDGTAVSVECVKMELSTPDSSGRKSAVEIKNSNFNIDADTVIIAIGTSPNPILKQTTEGLETDKKGCIVVKEDNVSTSKDGVFAGGDAVTGAATVILAMGAGKKAAEQMDNFIKTKQIQ